MANQLSQFRTEKGKEGIGFMGHVYRFGKRGAEGSMYWRCLLRDDCKGRLVTDNNKGNPQLRTAHSHVANEDEVRVRCTREQLRLHAGCQRNCINYANLPTGSARIGSSSRSGCQNAFLYESVAATMYKDRNANMPPLPASLRTL